MNKKSLAPPRRPPPPKVAPLKQQSPRSGGSTGYSSEKNHNRAKDQVPDEKGPVPSFSQRFKNKNLQSLPTQLLVTMCGLNTLDISYNRLSDSQIELVMNSCVRLSTLCIQGNLNCTIPAAVWKLKELFNFRHDWLQLFASSEEAYESLERLKTIKTIVQKPEAVVKVGRVVGLGFEGYCREVMHAQMDFLLTVKIQGSGCTPFAKEVMLKAILANQNTSSKQHQSRTKPVLEKQQSGQEVITGCGFGDNIKQNRPRNTSNKHLSRNQSAKELSEVETDAGSNKIQIKDIRDFEPEPQHPHSDKGPMCISSNYPLHQLFGNFDKRSTAPSEIDALLLRGYNPNQHDDNGYSPYHMAVIKNQRKGLDYLLNISAHNPGFFDLEMPSLKDGRNILHYSVFLKNYHFTKSLIEFGIPTDTHDSAGVRPIHLVDQNYEFLLLLRKLLRRSGKTVRPQLSLTVSPNVKRYVKTKQRAHQETKLRLVSSRNTKLLEMYESAVACPLRI